MMLVDEEQVSVFGPDEAPTLLLVHGSTVTRAMWRPQIEALAPEFRVLAPDLPGHGVLGDKAFTLDAAVAQLDAVLVSLAVRPAVIVGISLGGYVAIEYATRHPKRVAGLVLASTTTNFTGVLGGYVRVVGWVLGRVLPEAWQRVQLARGMRRKYPPGIAEPLIGAGLYPRAAGESFMELGGKDMLARLATIDHPVLFVNGAEDAASRRGEAAFLATVQQGRMEVIPGAGHLCNLQQPELFTRATRHFAHSVGDGVQPVTPSPAAPQRIHA